MQPYSAAKQWRDGFGANETRITAADLTHIEDGISAATQGVTNLETKVDGQPAEILKQVQSIAEGIKTLVNQVTPIGTIMMYGAERDPEGWMRCDGRLLDRNTYAKLYSVIGLTYGSTTVSNFRSPTFGNAPLSALAQAVSTTSATRVVTRPSPCPLTRCPPTRTRLASPRTLQGGSSPVPRARTSASGPAATPT